MNAVFSVLFWGAFIAAMLTVGLTDGVRPRRADRADERSSRVPRR